MYAPTVAYGTTVNCQLMLAMLIEKLSSKGFQVIGANTDAVNVLVLEDRWDEYIALCKDWDSITGMTLEHDEFEALYESSCNNYIAVMPGDKVKTKGFFKSELDLLKGYKHPIVRIALSEYFVNGIPLEETILNHDDIYDFCVSNKMGTSKKTGQPFIAYHNGKALQKVNRYFASKNGAYMYKSAGANMEHVLSDSGVTIFNKYEKKEMKDYGINYDFYFREARKIQRDIEPAQMSLF